MGLMGGVGNAALHPSEGEVDDLARGHRRAHQVFEGTGVGVPTRELGTHGVDAMDREAPVRNRGVEHDTVGQGVRLRHGAGLNGGQEPPDHRLIVVHVLHVGLLVDHAGTWDHLNALLARGFATAMANERQPSGAHSGAARRARSVQMDTEMEVGHGQGRAEDVQRTRRTRTSSGAVSDRPRGRQRHRATHAEPGWSWSSHVKPLAGTDLCEAPHFQYQVAGSLSIEMADGRGPSVAPATWWPCPRGTTPGWSATSPSCSSTGGERPTTPSDRSRQARSHQPPTSRASLARASRSRAPHSAARSRRDARARSSRGAGSGESAS